MWNLFSPGTRACLRGCAVTQQPEAGNPCEIFTLAALKSCANRLMFLNLSKSAVTAMNSIKHELSFPPNMLWKDLTRTKELPAGGCLIPIKVIWRVKENEGRFIASSDFYFALFIYLFTLSCFWQKNNISSSSFLFEPHCLVLDLFPDTYRSRSYRLSHFVFSVHLWLFCSVWSTVVCSYGPQEEKKKSHTQTCFWTSSLPLIQSSLQR